MMKPGITLGVVMVHLHSNLAQHIHRQRRAFAALSIGLSASLSTMTDARADASIVVDTSQTQSDCGSNCDDLSTLQNLFQDANIPGEPTSPGQLWYTPVGQMVADLKMKQVRLLHDDVYCDVDGNGNFGTNYNDGNGVTPGDCHPLDWQLQWAFSKHLSPHVGLASYMPPSFTSFGASATWPAAQKVRFQSYAYQLVNYIVQMSINAGMPSVVFEVSNEMDIADGTPQNFDSNNMSQATLLPLGPWGRYLWWIDPNSYTMTSWLRASSYPYSSTGLGYPYQADVRRLDQGYSPVYQIFAQAVDQVSSQISTQYPNFQITIAGPTTAGYSFLFNPTQHIPTFEEDFLDQILNQQQSNCASGPICNGQFNSRLDRYGFHYYGNAAYPPSPQPQQQQWPAATLETITTTIQNKLQSLGKSQIPLFMSEWGPADYDTEVNYSHKGAAWAASFLPEAVKAGVKMGSYLIMEDGYGYSSPTSPGGSTPGQASLLGKFIASDGTVSYYPKPPANVFKMFAQMTGTRRPATVSPVGGSSSNLGAFVTSDTSSAHVMVYNYDPRVVFNNDNNSIPETPENVSVELDNLPFPDGNVTVTRYLVDSVTSNFEAFLAAPTDPTKNPALQTVETFTAAVSNGQLILPSGLSAWA
jgi:hypothetical protein